MRPRSTFNMNHSSPYDFAQSRRNDIESAVVMADGREEEIIDLTEENEIDGVRLNPGADNPPEYSPPPSPAFESWTSHPQYTGNPHLPQQAGSHPHASGHAHLTDGTNPTSRHLYPQMIEQNGPGPTNAYRPFQSSGEQPEPMGPGSRVPVARMLPLFPVPHHGNLHEAGGEPQEPQRAPARRGRKPKQPASAPVASLREEPLIAAPAGYLDRSATQDFTQTPSSGSPGVGLAQASTGISNSDPTTRPRARNRRGQTNTGSTGSSQTAPAVRNGTTLADDGAGGPSHAPAAARRGRKRRGGGTTDPLDPEQAPDMSPMPQGIVGADKPSAVPAPQPARERRAGANNADPVGYEPAPLPAAMTPTPEGGGDLAEPITAPAPRRGRKRRAPADNETVAPAPTPILAPVLAPANRPQVASSRPPSENYFNDVSDRDLAALTTPAVGPEFVSESEARDGAGAGSVAPEPELDDDEEIMPRPTNPFEVPAHILEAYRMRPPVEANIPRIGGGLLVKRELGQTKRRRGNGKR